ncbi:hypothetical protein K431DRAFT_281180 [Polychaeton citri CBS 116435]|uniref:Uncharacterized protein n=1 Tax=Polychaeton citri CBS 116435 TaxID=1314669 RepID=A0A9P4QG76_9PEZI|nr:hypothetical protein K431DRAFT_281180 [Polychaeton citri CBS 116435]
MIRSALPVWRRHQLPTILFPRRSIHRSKPRLDSSANSSSSSTTTSSSRLSRLEARLPRFLRNTITPLRTAPFSHITAFLLLHELTAVIPLFGLAAGFHYYDWLPPYISEGAWVRAWSEKFGNYLRKKGWLGEEGKWKYKWFGRGEGSVRIAVELATAYAITKALLPIRLVISVWLTPSFAKWTVLPLTAFAGRILGMNKKKVGAVAVSGSASGAVGTGATAAGALPKEAAKPR